jgi:hypothetical protein
MFSKFVRYQLLIGLVAACAPARPIPSPTPSALPTSPPSATPTPAAPPADFNPLTGQPAAEPALLKTPALLISISHFPAFGRPQAGLSFAPFVYEISITEGASRFLAVFHGGFPEPETPLTGGCAVRSGAFAAGGSILGDRVWLDADADGQQGAFERGVGGVCVNLYDVDGVLLGQTTTDSNGYYGFDLPPGRYLLEFALPDWARYSDPGQGGESLDSDADPGSGRAQADVTSHDQSLDAGLVPLNGSGLSPDPALLPLAQVGPIRSGRLVYRYLGDSFVNSCLIYAGASSEVLARLPKCLMVFHQFASGGYMLDIDEMRTVARQNKNEHGADFDYGGYAFEDGPVPGGVPGRQLNVFHAYLNQSGWTYDPLYQAYLRFVDTTEKDLAGVLFPDRDRLTGRQLHFENVILLFARHDVVSPTNLDIRLNPGREGDAVLFRDGRMYEIIWRMPDKDQDHRMLQFLDADREPAALKPGHTWVIVMTNESELSETAPGMWHIRYVPPEGEAR